MESVKLDNFQNLFWKYERNNLILISTYIYSMIEMEKVFFIYTDILIMPLTM